VKHDVSAFGVSIGMCEVGLPALELDFSDGTRLHSHLSAAQTLKMLIRLHMIMLQMLAATIKAPAPILEFHEGTITVLEEMLQRETADEAPTAQEETDGPNPTKH
jgi:hypothetical protein